MSWEDIGVALFHKFLDWSWGSRYVVYVDQVSMKTYEFKRSIIKGYAGDETEYITCPYNVGSPDEIIPRIKREYFGNSDRYVRPFSKNIRTFIIVAPNDVNSYSQLFYDRYTDSVIGLYLKNIK